MQQEESWYNAAIPSTFIITFFVASVGISG
jgi:hypothetical protein